MFQVPSCPGEEKVVKLTERIPQAGWTCYPWVVCLYFTSDSLTVLQSGHCKIAHQSPVQVTADGRRLQPEL